MLYMNAESPAPLRKIIIILIINLSSQPKSAKPTKFHAVKMFLFPQLLLGKRCVKAWKSCMQGANSATIQLKIWEHMTNFSHRSVHFNFTKVLLHHKSLARFMPSFLLAQKFSEKTVKRNAIFCLSL